MDFVPTISDTFKVNINYNLTLEQMIALGSYYTLDHDILSVNFPIVGQGQAVVNLAVFSFDRLIFSNTVIKIMDSYNYRPAKLEHLLGYVAQNRGHIKYFPLSALGSIWQVSTNLSMFPNFEIPDVGLRYPSLKLRYFNQPLEKNNYFLAVTSS